MKNGLKGPLTYIGDENHASIGNQIEKGFDFAVLLKTSTDFVAIGLILRGSVSIFKVKKGKTKIEVKGPKPKHGQSYDHWDS